MPYWNPKTESKNFEFSPIWAPLAPYKEYVTAVSGLNNRQAMLGTGGGVHSRNCAAWLTGTLAKSTEAADVLLATTADQHAARVLGKETVFESLELSTSETFHWGIVSTTTVVSIRISLGALQPFPTCRRRIRASFSSACLGRSPIRSPDSNASRATGAFSTTSARNWPGSTRRWLKRPLDDQRVC